MVKNSYKKELDEKYGLKIDQIYERINSKIFNFKTTDEVKPSKGLERVIGQEEFYEPIMRALRINAATYNVIMVGPPGCGKSLLTKVCYEQIVDHLEVENEDQFCWYNFVDDRNPHTGKCPAGTAIKLRDDLLELVRNIEEDMGLFVENINKNNIPQEIEKKQKEIINQYNHELKIEDQKINEKYKKKISELGYNFDIEISDREIDLDLPHETKKQERLETYKISKKEKTNTIEALKNQSKVMSFIEEFKKEKEDTKLKYSENINNLAQDIQLNYVKDLIKKRINKIKKRYEKIPDIKTMLETYEKDLLIPKHFQRFFPKQQGMGEEHAGGRGDQKYDEYQINILVDNSKNPNKPNFEYLENPTRETLFGTVIWEALGNRGQKPHRLVRSGAMIRNNKGFVVIDEGKKIIYDPRNGNLQSELRDFLLTSLQNKKVKIGGGSSGSSHSSGIESEPAEADVSLILCANEDILPLLELNENQAFRRRFKVVLNMNYHMPNNLENRLKMARHYKDESLAENLLPATPEAIARVIEYQMTSYGKKRLTCQLDWIKDVYLRATDFAKNNKDKFIQKSHIDYALKSIIYEKNKAQRNIRENIKSDKHYLNKEPEIGVVNGLVCVSSGIAFGYPIRNTFNIKYNKNKGLNLTNIEEMVNLSGSSFNKSFKQSQTYLLNRLSHLDDELINIDLIYSISQGNNKVDGPSAGGVFTLGFISAMSNLPVRANTFFTGQIEPKTGKILPVGGINEKVMGAYHSCKDRNIKDGIAVIPKTNIDNLQLLDEQIIEDIKRDNFKIYAWDNIRDGEEIAFGINSEMVDRKIEKNLKNLKSSYTKKHKKTKQEIVLEEQLKTLKIQREYYENKLGQEKNHNLEQIKIKH